MHEPLKGPSDPSSPISPQAAKKRLLYDQARTKKPENERIQKMKSDRSISPSARTSSSPNNSSRRSRSIHIGGITSSPNNSSRRSRSIAVDMAIQHAREKVHKQKILNNSTDTLAMSSNHTNTSTISASAILDKRRPLHQDADGTIAPRPVSVKRVSTVDENDTSMNVILGLCSAVESTQQQQSQAPKIPATDSKKLRNGKTRRSNNNNNVRRQSNSASPKGRRSSNQRRTPAAAPTFPKLNDGKYNETMGSSDEEEEYNDVRPRPPRKSKTSKTSNRTSSSNVREARQTTKRRSASNDRNTQSLSPTRPPHGGGKIRNKRKPRVESVSSLSGSDSETGRRSRMRQQQLKATASVDQSGRTDEALQKSGRTTLMQSERSDLAVLSTKSPSLSPHRVIHASPKVSNSKRPGNNSNIPPPPPSNNSNPFQSPMGTRGTVSPLSSPSNHNLGEEISPLTASSKTFLTGPIRMQIPWANGADMGGAQKEPPRRMLPSAAEDEEVAEAEDSFEMNVELMEQSYEFGQLEVDQNPIRPDRLSSIRSLSYRERHLRSSYPHELEMYKGKSPNDPDYMPNQPTRYRASHRSSTGSYMNQPSSGTNRSSRGRVSMFENSYAHELDLYKYEDEKDLASPSIDKKPQRPTRLASMTSLGLGSLKFHQSSGDFSIGTYDTYKDGELRPASNLKLEQPKSNKKRKSKKAAEAPKDTDKAQEETEDIESVDDDSINHESTTRSLSPVPKERKETAQAPHTVGATAKRTIFLSPLAKINLPKSPGSLRGKRTFGWKKDGGDKKKSWLPSLGKGDKLDRSDRSEIDGSKRSTRSSRTSKRGGRTQEAAQSKSPTRSKSKSPTKDPQSSPGSLVGIKKAFQNRRGRSESPHGVKAASKKQSGRTKKKKQPKVPADS